eukprot:1990802-Lingulodinium_polyedra.AAC.1
MINSFNLVSWVADAWGIASKRGLYLLSPAQRAKPKLLEAKANLHISVPAFLNDDLVMRQQTKSLT